MNQYDIIAIGECLVDFVCRRADGKLYMEGNPGGAPVNVLAMAAKLGLRTSVVSKVGRDDFGDFLSGHVKDAGVGTEYLLQSADYPTTLAIVQLDAGGNRSFTFYRDRTADVMLRTEELPLEEIRRARILHFGSVSLTCEPSRSATFAAAKAAREAGVCVSYDPNLRTLLWEDLQTAQKIILAGLELADLVKVSDEELLFLTGANTVESGMEQLFQQYPMRLLAVTMGPKGCVCRTEAGSFSAYTFDTPCVDTTGAGDAFWGAALGWILQNGMHPEHYSAPQMAEFLDFANAAGSLATTKTGAIPAMPNQNEIKACIAAVPRLVISE